MRRAEQDARERHRRRSSADRRAPGGGWSAAAGGCRSSSSFGKVGLQRDVGHDRQRVGEPRRPARAGAPPTSRSRCWRREIGAEEVDRVGDLERRARSRALARASRPSGWRCRTCRPGRPPLPLRTTRLTCATGTSCSSTTQTGRPLRQLLLLNAPGSFSAGGGPRLRLACGPVPAARDASQRQRRAMTTERIHDDTANCERRLLIQLSSHHGIRHFAGFSGSTVSSTRSVARQELSAAAPDVGRRQRAIPREILVEPVGIAGVRCSTAFS